MNAKEKETVRLSRETSDPVDQLERMFEVLDRIRRLTDDHPSQTCQTINRIVLRALAREGQS